MHRRQHALLLCPHKRPEATTRRSTGTITLECDEPMRLLRYAKFTFFSWFTDNNATQNLAEYVEGDGQILRERIASTTCGRSRSNTIHIYIYIHTQIMIPHTRNFDPYLHFPSVNLDVPLEAVLRVVN